MLPTTALLKSSVPSMRPELSGIRPGGRYAARQAHERAGALAP